MLGKSNFDQILQKVFSLPLFGGPSILMANDRTHELARSKSMTETNLENYAIVVSTGQMAIAESIWKTKQNLFTRAGLRKMMVKFDSRPTVATL